MGGGRLSWHTASMTIRNTIIIILLCIVLSIVAADPFKDAAPRLSEGPARADLLDAAPAGRPRRGAARPTLILGRSEELQDAVAGDDISEPAADDAVAAPGGANTTVDLGGPPRGGGGYTPRNTRTSVDLGSPPRGGGTAGFAPPPNIPRPIISPSGPPPASADLPQ